MSTVLFWFCNDLRLHDQPALLAACAEPTQNLVPVYCLPDQVEITAWGFTRLGMNRRAWLASALSDLGRQLELLKCPLLICQGPAENTLPLLAQAVGATRVVCEEIAAPQEQAQVQALRGAGLSVQTVWQSSLLDPAHLPWPPQELPASFTPFRQAIEQAQLAPPAPLAAPVALPPWPVGVVVPAQLRAEKALLAHFESADRVVDPRSSFAWGSASFDGGEVSALAHLARYLSRKLPHSYKRTRNELSGMDFSSKWSPWLATGALSARQIFAQLREFEVTQGATDGSYWLWFELLWRDYFRFLHLQHGAKLYRARGLGEQAAAVHNAQAFEQWCQAKTGEPLVDAAMRELAATGYLSNRLRQVVASYLVYELGCDWRAGAAWFESQLLDYDVYSNQGNWLYIAGRGTDPRGGRRFNVAKQTAEYDPSGLYRRLWSAS